MRVFAVVVAVAACAAAIPRPAADLSSDDTIIVEDVVTPEGEYEVVGSLEWYEGNAKQPPRKGEVILPPSDTASMPEPADSVPLPPVDGELPPPPPVDANGTLPLPPAEGDLPPPPPADDNETHPLPPAEGDLPPPPPAADNETHPLPPAEGDLPPPPPVDGELPPPPPVDGNETLPPPPHEGDDLPPPSPIEGANATAGGPKSPKTPKTPKSPKGDSKVSPKSPKGVSLLPGVATPTDLPEEAAEPAVIGINAHEEDATEPTKMQHKALNIAIMGGAAGAGLLLVVVVVAGVRRLRQKKEGTKLSRFLSMNSIQDTDDLGLLVNWNPDADTELIGLY